MAAYGFELGKVRAEEIRAAVVEQINLIDHSMAARVAALLGLPEPEERPVDDTMAPSPALSQVDTGSGGIESRKIAVLAADGVDVEGTRRFIEAMAERGAVAEVLAPTAGGTLAGGSGGELPVDRAINTMASVLYDAVVVPCGADSIATLSGDGYALHFITEAYKHLKAVGAFGAGVDLLRRMDFGERLAEDTDVVEAHGVVSTAAAAADLAEPFFDAFATVLAKHRAWDRRTEAVPA